MRQPLRIDDSRAGPALWLCAGALGLAAYSALYEIRTYDTLFHLAAGRYALEHGRIPEHDPFSFTFRGALWVNHSSGFQTVLAQLYRWGGFELLSVYQACLAGLLCGLALLGMRGASTRQRMLGAVLAALPYCAFREVLEARPHVVGFVCLAAVLSLTLRAQAIAGPRPLVWTVPIYAAWAASHGSHVLAYVVFGIAAICAVRRRRRLSAGYVAVIAVCLLIMRAIAPWAFTQGVQHAGSLFLESAVSEWRPLTAADVFGTWPGVTFAGAWVASLAGAVTVARSTRNGEHGPRLASLDSLLLLGVFLVLALTSRRMIALFLFGAAPLWIPYAVHAFGACARALRFPARPVSTFAVCNAALLVSFAVTYLQGATFHSGAGLERDRFPIAAVAAMRASGRVQRIYNAYNFGGYLMFASVPAQGVFVDGRAITVYPPEFLSEFQAAYADPSRFERLAQRFACDAVLLPARSELAAGLRSHLQTSDGWRLTHRDPVAELYEHAALLTATQR